MQYRINTFENALDLLDTAVFLLNAKGVLYYSNAAGKKLLEKRDGLTEVSSCLVAVDRHAQTRFVKLMRSALVAMGAHGSAALPRQHSPRPLIARVMPVAQKSDFLVSEEKASAIVFVTDPDWLAGDAISEVMDTYGLTPSEKRLLNELLAGQIPAGSGRYFEDQTCNIPQQAGSDHGENQYPQAGRALAADASEQRSRGRLGGYFRVRSAEAACSHGESKIAHSAEEAR